MSSRTAQRKHRARIEYLWGKEGDGCSRERNTYTRGRMERISGMGEQCDVRGRKKTRAEEKGFEEDRCSVTDQQ